MLKKRTKKRAPYTVPDASKKIFEQWLKCWSEAARYLRVYRNGEGADVILAARLRDDIRQVLVDIGVMRPFPSPIPMLLWCPKCGARHLDEGEFATKPHHNHACQECGLVWRPALVATVGVKFLPGYKNP